MFKRLLPLLPRARLRAFGKDTRGYVTVEAMIVLPALLWLFGVGWVYFDVFRQQSVNQKANYTIGDMLSRQTDPVDDSYIDSAFNLLKLLNKAAEPDSSMRVSVVQYRADGDNWRVQWSEARGGGSALGTADLTGYAERLPVVSDAAQLILVETWDEYAPVFQVGLGDFTIKTYSFTAPRYAPQLVWASGAEESA
ncbi:TadE/TadG family type IV pilus assembly protein [Ponticoccus litoralis]|uniref:Flp pilus assembly protein TadG n=1 Tax=Ponticoccus litoralis TaxID=422297 RepID=A0AAW9SJJ4_9RHOB